jgi:hypothetical protein
MFATIDSVPQTHSGRSSIGFEGTFFEFFPEDCFCAAGNVSFSRARKKSIVGTSYEG